MKAIAENSFKQRSEGAKEAIARLPENREIMEETQAMCDPHGSLDNYSPAQWVELAEAVYTTGGELLMSWPTDSSSAIS